jgi:hypothetical protein
LYDQDKQHYQGGCWIETLDYLIANDGEIDLSLATFTGLAKKI